MTNPLFEPNQAADQQIDNPLETLVGEGKKYKDAAALAFAAIEKDRFIEQLKSENAQMRNSLKGEQKIDEFLTRLNQSNTQPAMNSQGQPSGQNEANQQTQTNQPKAATLDEVEAVLARREREREAAQNLKTVQNKLTEAYGANYQHVLIAKATALGMTPDEMLEVAKTRPMAFLKLVEADKVGNTASASAPRSSVNTAGMNQNNSNERNYKFYQNLRKEMGDARFFAPKVQNELHKDALRLGAAFYE
jgi:hypothetical protein